MGMFRNFISKYKIALSIIIILILSFFIYLLVSAEEDIYANQIEVQNTKITIKDGTENNDGKFDSDDEVGNDSSNNNNIVRNFDTIEYDISYDLEYKKDSSLEEKPLDPIRSVKVDVLVPASLSANISEGDLSNPTGYENKRNILINSVEYNYYTFLVRDVIMTDKNITKINISNINMKNGTQIKPIIRVRESTDEKFNDYDENSDLSDALDIKSVVVTAKDSWDLKLYNGVVKGKEVGNATLPIGIAVYMPNDSNKGIKGIHIPSELSFNISINPDSNISNITDIPTIENYSEDSGYVIGGLPYSYDNENGKAGIEKIENNLYKVTYKNLVFHDQTINLGTEENPNYVNYVSTKQIIVNTRRTNLTNKNNINYTISANGKTINMLDNYVPFVGDYLSKVDFINSNNIQISGSSSNPVTTLPNSAIYNYNEEFYIQNTINYGLNVGDDLPNGLTNYLKIDNTAIKLVDVGNLSDESLDYYIKFSEKDEKREYTVQYGIGEWNSSYFKIKNDAPSYCPTNLTNLTKEQLMNYYGGPCIEENNSLKWYNSIEDAAAKDESNRDKIIAVKFNVVTPYKTGVTTTMRFKAIVKYNTNLVGNSYQVVARGLTNWEQNDIIEKFYMYETGKDEIPVNLSKQSNDINYSKLIYDNVNYAVSKEESPKSKYGNSIIVSGLKASINEIKVLDKYDSEKNIYYSGQNDPMEIQVRPVIYKSDMNATITDATIKVSIPSSLKVAILKGDKKPTDVSPEICDTAGNCNLVYTYNYTENDIKYENNSAAGTIPVLKIHAYIAINTLDDTTANITAVITGKLKPNTSATLEISTNTPESLRTGTKSIVLKNLNDISTLGSIGTNFIEANQSYGYNMQAVNLTKTDAVMELLNILPYNGDSIASSYGSNYSGKISIGINGTLPSGYVAYYTKDNPKTILNSEIKKSSSVNWIEWNKYNVYTDDVTAIKIVSTNPIKTADYFGGSTGITINVKTNGNKELDTYYNNFYILHKNSVICNDELTDENQNEIDCKSTEIGTKVFGSNVSSVSVYNRTISGYVFDDEDYNGFYNSKEPRLSDIIVNLYKTNANVTDSKKPLEFISSNDELISETTTDLKGSYKFKALSSGNYYVKYTFDCDKYTVTDKNKQDPTIEGDASLIDSDAEMVGDGTCTAVSNIISLSDSIVTAKNIDLGLRVKQDFDIKMNKYITNVTVTSNKGVQSYNYDKQTKVNVPVRNLKNTSFKVSYLIELENSRYFPGTIGNIIETIPDGMTFNPNLPENDGWYESDGNLYYKDFNKTMIMPGEKYYLTIVLDLVTDNGGDYINFVSATDLKIKPIITNFVESIDDTKYEIVDDSLEKGVSENE